MQIYEELKARGLIAQVTDEEEIRELVNGGKAVFYIGFDPTADSLHVGHFMALCLMKHGGRSLRPVGHAADDDHGDHPAQLRLLQKADGAVYRVWPGQGNHGE